MKKYKNFTSKEFDCPSLKGSGENMQEDFMDMLQDAREIAGCVFRITSGYRTQQYHDDLGRRGYKTAKKSAHLEGRAADIACTDSVTRWLIVNSLLLAGFNRIGIASTFIHVDNSDTKKSNTIWTY